MLPAGFLDSIGADQWYAHHWALAVFKMTCQYISIPILGSLMFRNAPYSTIAVTTNIFYVFYPQFGG